MDGAQRRLQGRADRSGGVTIRYWGLRREKTEEIAWVSDLRTWGGGSSVCREGKKPVGSREGGDVLGRLPS